MFVLNCDFISCHLRLQEIIKFHVLLACSKTYVIVLSHKLSLNVLNRATDSGMVLVRGTLEEPCAGDHSGRTGNGSSSNSASPLAPALKLIKLVPSSLAHLHHHRDGRPPLRSPVHGFSVHTRFQWFSRDSRGLFRPIPSRRCGPSLSKFLPDAVCTLCFEDKRSSRLSLSLFFLTQYLWTFEALQSLSSFPYGLVIQRLTFLCLHLPRTKFPSRC